MPDAMIVDDVLDSVEPLAIYLRRMGYDVRLVTNAQEALAEVVRSPPEVLLLDLHMPEMDGAWLLVALRSCVGLTTLPVVVLTGAPDGPLIQQVRDLGVNIILPKGKATFVEVEAALRISRHRVPGAPTR